MKPTCFTLPKLWHRLLVSALALLPALAHAGEFGVTPIRLDLDRNTRTGSVTVYNEDQDNPLQVQMHLHLWEQDETGADKLSESSDLSFFPRLMNLPAKEQRLLRAGIKLPPGDQERAYRLFIEEIPDPARNTKPGTNIAVAIRFGLPVFVKPLVESPKAEIESIRLEKGKLSIKVANTGNVHFRILNILLAASEGFQKEINGWYLLPGIHREYSLVIPADTCKKLGKIDITVKTDLEDLRDTLTIDKAQCS